MSMQEGAKTVDELLNVIKPLAKEMKDFSDCYNSVKEILITFNEDNNSFTITSD